MISHLAHRLRLERRSEADFLSGTPSADGHIFGGLLASQALQAAAATVADDKVAHSIHGHFLHSGDGRWPVWYHVETTRDGSHFSLRRVVAHQEGQTLFVAGVSFHLPEPGPDYELPGPPLPPLPDHLPAGRYDNPWFESRDVPVGEGTGRLPHTRQAWFRVRHPLPDDTALHAQALVYLTDHGATRAIRQPHTTHPGVEQRMSVSLDHAVWLHRQVRVEGWLLSQFSPIATGAARGLTVGTIRTADGHLVATVAQEALLRLPDASG